MNRGDYARLFARDVAVDPPVGGQTNVQAALGTGGSGGGLSVVRFPFAFNTSNIVLTGVPIYPAQKAGDILFLYTISVTTAWDGTTPRLDLTDASHVGNFLDHITLGNADIDYFGDGTLIQIAAPFNFSNADWSSPASTILTADLLTAVISDGSGGNPGSTMGAAELILLIIPAP